MVFKGISISDFRALNFLAVAILDGLALSSS